MYRFRTFFKEINLLSCRMVSVFGKIMHAEFALCKNYDFASLKYDRIGTYSANFSSICAGRRIQFEPKSRAEIRSAGRYARRRPPSLEPWQSIYGNCALLGLSQQFMSQIQCSCRSWWITLNWKLKKYLVYQYCICIIKHNRKLKIKIWQKTGLVNSLCDYRGSGCIRCISTKNMGL